MKSALRFLKLTFLLAFIFLIQKSSAQTFCHANGNVIIYSNYDGGYLNINVDQHIPNLKIGVTTYEDCEVSISGTYASDVVQVIYAGYQGNNQHCNPSPLTTSVNGVPANIVTLYTYPPATWSNPYGYPDIICNYQCDSASYQGGCNTPDQIAHYYLTQFGGSLYYHFTQYNCWQGTYFVSSGGNCCIGADIIPPQYSLNASFNASADTVCAEQGIFFTNTSTSTYPGSPQYNWNFGDGSPNDTTTNAAHGYAAVGNYIVTLTITDSTGIAVDTQTMVIVVINCGTGIDELNAGQIISVSPNPAHDVIEVQMASSFALPATAEILDVMGRSCVTLVVTDNQFTLPISKLPHGVYELKLQGENWMTVKRIVKQ